MSGQTCSLCGMVVSKMNIHMKMNHKKKKVKSSTCSGFGFTGIDSDKFTTTVIPEKDKSDIIPIITKSKLTENKQSKEFENRSQRIKRNVSMLSEVLEQETDKRLRGLDDTSDCDVKESGSSDIFQPKLDMLGIENRRNQKELDSSRYKECPDCKTLFEGNRSGYRFVNREYFDHVGSCGLDVGLGYGVTMVVKETGSVKCEPEDIPIKQKNMEGIQTENVNLDNTLHNVILMKKQKETMETTFQGRFRQISTENLEEFLRVLGVDRTLWSFHTRSTSELELRESGKGHWTWTSTVSSPLGTHTSEVTYTLGEEFINTTSDGRKVKCLTRLQDGEFITVQKPLLEGQHSTVVFCTLGEGGRELVVKNIIIGNSDVVCVYKFRRINI